MKQPPIAKVYEALTAIASNRIELKDTKALVYSSDGKKSYKVEWYENQYSSNDNATFWQGYPGYPVIAVLLSQEKIPYNKDLVPYLKDINWHELNEKYKRKYDEAIAYVLDSLDEKIKEAIVQDVQQIYDALLKMNLVIVKKINRSSN